MLILELLLILIESVLERLNKEGFLILEHPLSFLSALLELPLEPLVLCREVPEPSSFQLVVGITQLQIFDERLQLRYLLTEVVVLVAHLPLQGLLMLTCVLEICGHLRNLGLALGYSPISLPQLVLQVFDAVKQRLLGGLVGQDRIGLGLN